MCYYMQPYSEFDIQLNPLVFVMDWYGIFLVNISTNHVNQIQLYEDQALYCRSQNSNRSSSANKHINEAYVKKEKDNNKETQNLKQRD